MSVPDPRYHFNPLERRGILLGITPGQLASGCAAGVAALLVRVALGARVGTPAGAAIVLVGSALSLIPIGEATAMERAQVGCAWLLRKAGRTKLSDVPTEGRNLHPDDLDLSSTSSRSKASRTAPAGISIIERPVSSGGPPVGVVRDQRSGTLTAVIAVQGPPFSLLDPEDQSSCLEGWRSVLAALGRAGSPIARIQWLQRSTTESPSTQAVVPSPLSAVSPDAYRSFVTEATPLIERHDAWIALSVGSARVPRRRLALGQRSVDVLGRELRFVDGQLRSVDLRPTGPLELTALADLLAGKPGEPWPLALREGWSEIQADDSWHRTYWVSDWPRLDVGPNFLAPLLVAKANRRMSVVMAAVAPRSAVRQARSARTADVADTQLRMKAGFLPNARREKEAEGALRRELELADGHCDYRFSGYVTESAESLEALEAACAALEQAAQAARVELRCLYGRQAEAYSWTMPLCRGLR